MQTTSELYKELLTNGATKECKIEIAGEVYEEDRISSLFTTGSLFSSDTLSVGCAVARQIDLVLKNYGNIPKMAKLVPYYRLVNGDTASEWIQKGVFYIDTREPDKVSGKLTIHGFDDMLKGSVIWEPDQTLTFPMTFRKAAEVIAGLMGVELDNPEDIDESYQIVDYPANEYTQRNILQFIAAAHAANFVMTDLGKLRMVGINDIPAETGHLVTESGSAIVFGGVRIKVSETSENNLTGGGSKVYVGGMAASTGAPPAYDPVSKVVVKVDEENAWVAGDDTGHTLEVTCPYGTQAMADNVLSKVKGFVYQPLTAEDALVDQAIELGDGITVDGVYTILAQQEITFDSLMAGRISAPGQNEVESEYPYQTKEQQIDYKLASVRSSIEKTSEEIALRVTGEEAEALIQTKLEEITIAVTSNSIGTRVSITAGGVTVNSSIVDIYVDAVNINGKLTADQIVTDGITASIIKGSSVNLLTDDENTAGTLQMTGASTAEYAVELASNGALRLVAGSGSAYIEGSGSALDLSYYASFAGDIGPSDDGAYSCGLSNRAWSAVYAESSEIVTSDENRKHDIEDLPEKYVQLILWLTPKRFKLDSGTSGRDHVGFTAQNVKEGMDIFDIDPLEFGGWCEDKDDDGNPIYMLRYEEFIAILAAVIQDHEARLRALEG